MTLSFQSNRSKKTIFDHLTNMQLFVKVHPVIYKIESKGGNEYLIYERLKFLFIPVSFTYPAKVEVDDQNDRVILSAVVKKNDAHTHEL